MRLYRTLIAVTFAAFGIVALSVRPAAAQAGPFSDVPATHWAAQSVAKLAAAGIVYGYPQQKSGSGAAAQKYNGDRPVTRYELAVTLYKFVQYMERADQQKKGNMKVEAPMSGQDAVKKLIAGGYLPANTPLAKEGDKLITANQLADAMSSVITQIRAKKVPITPDSLKTQPIEPPGGHDHGKGA